MTTRLTTTPHGGRNIRATPSRNWPKNFMTEVVKTLGCFWRDWVQEWKSQGGMKITNTNSNNLLNQYETISIKDCKKEAAKYLALDSNGKLEVNKKAQMSPQMLTCIQNSISDKRALKVVTSRESLRLKSRMEPTTKSPTDPCTSESWSRGSSSTIDPKYHTFGRHHQNSMIVWLLSITT